MKKFMICLLLLFLSAGCSKSRNVMFCEGSSTEGEGVNCGTRFEGGDLTAIIKSSKSFGTDKIDLKIYETGKNTSVLIRTQQVNVNPDRKQATADMSFYSSGLYRVEALYNGKVFADGDVEIVDY